MSLETFSQRYAALDATTAGVFGFDLISGTDWAVSKIAFGALGSITHVDASNPLPVVMPDSLLDDAAFSPGTSRVLPAGYTFDDVAPDSVNEGDIGAVRMSANRCVYVMLRDNAGNERGLNIDSSGNLTANITGTVTVGSHAVTNAGVFAVQVDGAALTALQLIDNLVLLEDSAHVSGDPGIQMLAVQKTADGALASDLDYASLQLDENGYLKVNIKAGAGSGGTASTDDGAFTAASGSGTPMMGFVTSDSVDSGDVGVIGMLANRQQKVTLYDSTGVELSVGGGTQYTEDAAAAANPVGNALIAVRDDVRVGSLTTTDGDNVALRGTNSGELYVKHVDAITVNSHAVTNAGTFAVQVTSIASGTNNIGDVDVLTLPNVTIGTMANLTESLVDDAAFTPATSRVIPVGFTFDDVAPDSVNEGDIGAGRMSANRNIYVNIRDNAGNERGLNVDSSGNITVNVTGSVTVASHAVTNAGTFVVQIDGTALTRLTDIETNTDSGAVVNNGAAATAQRVTIANDSTGILAGVTTVTTVTTCSTVTTLTGSSIAHDGVDSGNPHKIGARATAALSTITKVAAADRTDLLAGVDGVLLTRPHCNLEDTLSGNASNTDGTSTQCIAAQTGSIKTYLTTIILTNTSSTNIYVEIKDGTSVKLTIPVPANGGAVISLPVPLGGTAATAWNFDPSTAATTVYCSMIGFKSLV